MTIRTIPPLGWNTASPEPISSGKLKRSSSEPSLRWSRRSASSRNVRYPLRRVLAGPGGAVDPLQLRVALIREPVRRGGAHQFERVRRDVLGARHVRTAAQVRPAHRAAPVCVVVHRQLGPADLHDLVALAALLADQLDLEGLGGQLPMGLFLGDDPPVEASGRS